ncbi:PhoH family protein [bacterium]|nr:PhoH family protein [bacterium]
MTKPRAKQPTSNSRKKKKLFVVDTNVLLHDPNALRQFGEQDLAIPITVIEELDQFKRGTDTINFNARESVRILDELAGNGDLTKKGVVLGSGLGNLRVLVSGPPNDEVRAAFQRDVPDHRILSAALDVKEKEINRDVILVSKDVSLRLKARSLGMPAEDYESDKVADLDSLYKGRFKINSIDDGLIDLLFQEPYKIPHYELDISNIPNAYYILRGSTKSAIARFDANENALVRVEKRTAFGIYPRNSEQTFALDALLNDNIQLVTLSGKAGTGKTLLALAGAMESRNKYQQIHLARPIIPLGNREIGYLPGDVKEKISPYMQPLWDNLGVIRSQYKANDPMNQKIQSMLDNEKLSISALAYIRGRSLNRIYFIVDEAQNLTGHEVKTIITRAGEGTKIVFTGDPQQIDTPYLDSRSNGLTRLIDRMKGQGLYAHVTLEKGERSELSDLASEIL